MTEIPYAIDHEWIRVPSDNKQKIACCHCGLVHAFKFRITKEGRYTFIEWSGSRDMELPAEIRKSDTIVLI